MNTLVVVLINYKLLSVLKKLFIIPILFISFIAKSQIHVDAGVSTMASFSSFELKPLWMHANQWGVIDPLGKADAMILGDVELSVFRMENFTLDAGIAGVVRNPANSSFLHELYLSGKVTFIDFIIGKKAYSPHATYDHLSSGSYLLGSNARPVPKISFGIYSYLPVPYSFGWIEVKGYLSQGILNEEPLPRVTGNVLHHEKFAYVRIGKYHIKPYGGLTHSALFGGERYDGSKIPVDFWATLWAKGSEKLGGGELTNAAGGHEGFWDFGIDADFDFGSMHLGMRKPFTDRNGYILKHAFRRNQDYNFIWHFKLNNSRFVKQMLVEFVKTDHQSGEGIPDPLYPAGFTKDPAKVGQLIFPWLVSDWEQYMEDNFTGIPRPDGGWNARSFEDYWQTHFNQGHIFGGRADNLNNGMYYRGYSYHGQSMGTPLFHTYSMVKAYAPNWTPNNHGIFINNRVRALHLGLQGDVTTRLDYIFKLTMTANYGHWAEKYRSRYSWELTPNYFFGESKYQHHSYLKLNYRDWMIEKLNITGAIGYDFGELYNSFGVNIGIEYRF